MKAKELFESSRIPFWFPKERDTWIDCNDGKVRIHWLGNRWVVLATRQRAMYPDERELRGIVSELVVQLGGLAR
jgi:hypothetical protein